MPVKRPSVSYEQDRERIRQRRGYVPAAATTDFDLKPGAVADRLPGDASQAGAASPPAAAAPVPERTSSNDRAAPASPTPEATPDPTAPVRTRGRANEGGRYVGVRVPAPARGLSARLDAARDAHGESKAVLGILRKAWPELEADLAAGRVTEVLPPYAAEDRTIKTSRTIDETAFEKGRQLVDPYEIHSDHAVGTMLVVMALSRFFEKGG